jgi:putative transposase
MPVFNPEIHHRRSVRLIGFDYSRPGYYFVTICLNDVRCMLATVPVGVRSVVGVRHGEPLHNTHSLQLSPIGEIAKRYWLEIPHHYPKIVLDEFVIMPDHVHGILKIRDMDRQWSVGVRHGEPLHIEPLPPTPSRQNEYQHIIPQSLGIIVNHFKSAMTRWTRKNGFPQFKWQRSFHDRIIRDEKSLFHIRQYIWNNPAKWSARSDNHLLDELKNLHPDGEMSA